MAGGMDLGTGGKGKKKSLDAAINLVPFIDLMAVTISFLIMTAVWNQISRLTVSQSGGPGESSPLQENKSQPVNLLLTDKGFTLTSGAIAVEIPKTNGVYVYCHTSGADRVDDKCEDHTLVSELRKLKAELPEQRNITVQCDDGVKYNDLVRVIDICNLKDAASKQPALFPEVAVSAIG